MASTGRLIYLGICCFNRPFDDQSDLLVRLQTEAKLHVQDLIRKGELLLAWSAIMDIENLANPDINRKEAVAGWQKLSSVDLTVSENIEKIAETLALIGIKPMDALHVSSAIEVKAVYFLTTDKALLRKMKADNRTQVIDPVDFIRLLSENQNEN